MDWMLLFDRSICLMLPLEVMPKSGGREDSALCDKLTTSRWEKQKFLEPKMPALISEMSFQSTMICSRRAHFAKSSENLRKRLFDILKITRLSHSLSKGGTSSTWQWMISMACSLGSWLMHFIMPGVRFAGPCTRSSDTCCTSSTPPRALTFTFTWWRYWAHLILADPPDPPWSSCFGLLLTHLLTFFFFLPVILLLAVSVSSPSSDSSESASRSSRK
mmetsp:Transcript_120158/g.374171  ORF Transcript_120158/g.374171 Transcript_120158/m.374171 type:complete len:218 (-) Transcript_120158:142-795(-)